MFLSIVIQSKEKKKIKKFVVFLSKVSNFISIMIIKKKTKKKIKKFVTVLKSPHVNKTAQEQFEFEFFTKQILLYSSNFFLYSLFLKNIVKYKFPGIKLKFFIIFEKKKHKKILLSFLNPDIMYLKKKFAKIYLKMFDFYGEIFLLKI